MRDDAERGSLPEEAAQRPALAGARGGLALLLAINLFNYLDRQVLAAVVPDIERSFFSGRAKESLAGLQAWCQAHLGFQPELALIGTLSMAFMVLYMTGAPVFARLAERHPRWRLIGVAVILWSLASGASGLAAGFLALFVTRCFVGIGEAAYGPSAPALICDYYPRENRGRVLALFYMAIPVGSALGYVFGGLVAHSSIGALGARLFGVATESWRWAFLLVVPPGLLLGAWCFRMREPRRGQADGGAAAAAPAAPPRWRDYRVLLQTPSYVLCTLGGIAMTFAVGGIGFWMPRYLQARAGAAATGFETPLFGAITAAAGLAGTLLGGLAGDRLRRRWSGSYFLVSGAAMLAGFPAMLWLLRAPFPWIWIAIFVTVFCLFFGTGPTNTVLANVTHPAIRAAAFALNILAIHALGDVISPVVIGVVSDRHSMHAAFELVSAMFVASGMFWLWGARHLARDTALAAERYESAKRTAEEP
jgi:MFS transporter, Spinster family, sphingosine-1-phosphate transporter